MSGDASRWFGESHRDANTGRWESMYRDETNQRPYGDTTTYELGARWLVGLDVEDWGCGLCWMKRYFPAKRYRGIDGSWSRFVDEVVDLEHYRSQPPAIFMRHVLEHNWQWQRILDNAVASFTRRMALVIFTPWAEETHPIAVDPWLDVPDLSFRRDDVIDHFAEVQWTSRENMPTATQYKTEHIFFLERSSEGR
jgi:hypothetical protein